MLRLSKKKEKKKIKYVDRLQPPAELCEHRTKLFIDKILVRMSDVSYAVCHWPAMVSVRTAYASIAQHS